MSPKSHNLFKKYVYKCISIYPYTHMQIHVYMNVTNSEKNSETNMIS